MHLCVVSFKPCWQDAGGVWMSDGGFPLQMAALTSLFDRTTMVIVRTPARAGGLALPASAEIVALDSPAGADGRRKISVAARLAYYLRTIAQHARRADVVHAPVPGDISTLGMVIGLALRKRVIARYGSSWATTAQTTLSQRLTRACMRAFAGGRNVMLATGVGAVQPAPGMRWIFSTALTREELGSIPANTERELGSPVRLVYVGRLSPEKGVHVLLEALGQLGRASARPVHLHILGDGPARAALEKMTDDLGLRSSVTFHGHLNRKELSTELRTADLCVQPSLTEGFSKAWLDAMAHGVPVLSSRVGAAASVIGDDGARGWLVPPGQPEALAAMLTTLLTTDVDWPAVRRRSRAFVEGRTLEAWAREIGEICCTQWGARLVDGRLRL